MGDKSRGLYPEGKFIVRRRDGTDETGGKHDGCNYFVLDITHDPHAIPAIRSYAASARKDGYELLADDLERIAATTSPSETAVGGEADADERAAWEKWKAPANNSVVEILQAICDTDDDDDPSRGPIAPVSAAGDDEGDGSVEERLLFASDVCRNQQLRIGELERRYALLLRYADHLRGCASYTNSACTCGLQNAMRSFDIHDSDAAAQRSGKES